MIKKAQKLGRKHKNISFIVTDVIYLPFRDGIYDLITMWSTYGIIPLEAFPELIRSIKANGTLAICETNTHIARWRFLLPFLQPYRIYVRLLKKRVEELIAPEAFLKRLGLHSVRYLCKNMALADIELVLARKR